MVAVASQGICGAFGARPHAVNAVIIAHELGYQDLCYSLGARDMNYIVVILRVEGRNRRDAELFSKGCGKGTDRKRTVRVQDVEIAVLQKSPHLEVETGHG